MSAGGIREPAKCWLGMHGFELIKIDGAHGRVVCPRCKRRQYQIELRARRNVERVLGPCPCSDCKARRRQGWS